MSCFGIVLDKESIQLSTVKNVHIVAELFKQLLIALPEPPFPFEVYDSVMWTLGTFSYCSPKK